MQKLSAGRYRATSRDRLRTRGEGLRIGEAIKLDRGDVDWAQGVLLIRESKFGKSRLVPLHPSSMSAQLINNAGIGAGAVSPPRPHDLRHTFAVRTLLGWYRAGEDVQSKIPSLSTYLGHREPASTYWYLSAAPELLALAAARQDTAWSAARP